jgi:proteic killer suppression protein
MKTDAERVNDAWRECATRELRAQEGGLAGKHSIRIHDQWRLGVSADGPEEVEIADYHR